MVTMTEIIVALGKYMLGSHRKKLIGTWPKANNEKLDAAKIPSILQFLLTHNIL